ncbi:MAG: hypothetical protein M1834_007858 [Cirrosporium novae-zelandiae]|nr:MAG: hypothetical protein M1834_007858 [Cirrosporium novae-zelandiae]
MESALETVSTWGNNFTTNVARDWIRLILILFGYMLLRPRMLSLVGKMQAKQQTDEDDRVKQEAEEKARLDPNSLRGLVQVPEDTDDEEDEQSDGKAKVEWGKQARRRQRKMIRKILEAEEKVREQDEAESDKEIEEFLEQ